MTRTTADSAVNLVGPNNVVHATHPTSWKRTKCMHIYNRKTWEQTTKPVTCLTCLYGNGSVH